MEKQGSSDGVTHSGGDRAGVDGAGVGAAREAGATGEVGTGGEVADPAAGVVAEGPGVDRRFTGGRLWALGLLAALLTASVVVLWVTRDAMGHLSFLHAKKNDMAALATGSQKALVDLRPWQTAQALAPLAVTAEEVDDAQQAEALADHEADQTFATALRKAGIAKPKLTPEAVALTAKVAGLQATVKEDTAVLRDIVRSEKVAEERAGPAGFHSAATGAGDAKGAGGGGAGDAKAAGGSGDGKGTAGTGEANTPAEWEPNGADSDDVSVAKAQLKLDLDQLNDAQDDLARAAGDDRTRIQQELAAHEASLKEYDAHPHDAGQMAVISAARYGTLAGQVSAWWAQHVRSGLIQQAMHEAQQEAAGLAVEHNRMDAEAGAAGGEGSANLVGQSTGIRLARMRRLSAQRQMMGIYDDRIATEQALAGVYAKWGAQVSLQRGILLHLMLQSAAWIVLILLCVVVMDTSIQYWTERRALDRRRLQTMRRLIQLVLWLVGFAFVALVVFGAPQQAPTVIGLITAGLTVAMQDFIVAFLGWFVLMGKNGMRVGDAVEINAVAGEVTDIGLFRTTLLETGNWTDKGHPTGRRVSFLNGFAIRGQYFNFTTTGQWMWDQISVSVPAGDNTYGEIELIHKAVLELTSGDAKLAEEEWRRTARVHGLGQFSAQPAVDLRPAASGMDIKVRYVTRASDRVAKRNELYQRVVDVLQGRSAAVQVGEVVGA